MKDNTEVRVYDEGTTTELAGTENATSGTPGDRSYTFSLDAAEVVDIRIYNTSYLPESILSYTIPGSAASIPVQQRLDRNYVNP